MPVISDLIGGSTHQRLNECAALIQAANVMKCSVKVVRRKFAKFGTGMIYTRGLVMGDTPQHRAKLTEMYGEIIILRKDGSIFLRTISCRGQMRREQLKVQRKRERDLQARDRESRRKEAATLKMFRDGQTNSSPKRQGQGRSRKDIGKYVSERKTRTIDFYPWPVDKFRTIHIPNLSNLII